MNFLSAKGLISRTIDAREPNARHADEKIRKALARGRGRHGQPFTFARTSLSL
jgi:hypothetical protein